MQVSIDSGADATAGSITGYRRYAHSATCTASGDSRFCGCTAVYVGPVQPTKEEKRSKYDPFKARQMWHRDALPETRRPRKRPSRQVAFNQVSRLRPVRPRYLSRKR